VLTWVFCDLMPYDAAKMDKTMIVVNSKFELAESRGILRYFFVCIAKPKDKNYRKLNRLRLNSFS
jgi:hypothetical protein